MRGIIQDCELGSAAKWLSTSSVTKMLELNKGNKFKMGEMGLVVNDFRTGGAAKRNKGLKWLKEFRPCRLVEEFN